MRRCCDAAGGNDFAIFGNSTDSDGRGSIRRRCGELHHDGRVLGALEVPIRPFARGVVGFHALQSVDEKRLALEVDGPVLGRHGSLGGTSRPEGVSHSAPGLGEVRTKQCVAVLTCHEGRGGAGNLEVDNAALIGYGLDGVGLSVFRKLDGAVLCVEVHVVVAEVDIVQSGRAPQVGLGGVGIRDLRVELARDANTASR